MNAGSVTEGIIKASALKSKERFQSLSGCPHHIPSLFDFNLADKVVVGSYMGMLRIFTPLANKTSEGSPADAQLLEVQLHNAIIQVEVGKFVS